jgi:hypothetical protein
LSRWDVLQLDQDDEPDPLSKGHVLLRCGRERERNV